VTIAGAENGNAGPSSLSWAQRQRFCLCFDNVSYRFQTLATIMFVCVAIVICVFHEC
jgi:hypothetical protein